MTNKKLTRDGLKYLALIPMSIGHFCGYIWGETLKFNEAPYMIFLTGIALLAPPIFFFFIAEGFAHTRSKGKYALRLLVFAAINQVCFVLANYKTLFTENFFDEINIFFTLFLGLITLIVRENKKIPTALRVIIIIIIDAATLVLSSEWMIFGAAMILGFHVFREKPKARLIWFTSCAFLMKVIDAYFSAAFYSVTGMIETVFHFAVLMLSYFIVTKFYGGEKGKHPTFSKWFFYIFYPVHLLVIFAVKIIFNI